MQRIDLFLPPLSQYGVLHHFTQCIYEALQNSGIEVRLLEAQKDNPLPFLEALTASPPDCTLSFNGLLPDEHGRFFSDMIQIPHVACLVDSPNHFLPLINSAYTVITCVDQVSVEFLQGLGFSKAFFLPHAVESKLASSPIHEQREYDVVMLSSCIDYEKIHASWKQKFSPPLRQAMEEAAEMALSNYEIPYYKAFVSALDRQISRQADIDPRKLAFMDILDELEMYIRGKDRVELLKSITDARIDLFGSGDKSGGWEKYLGKKRNIIIHDPVPFEQALEIMKHTKILLNSCAWIKKGAHERVFAGMASGALVITDENTYLREEFQDGQSIVFYQSSHWNKADHRINEYLESPSKREKIVENGKRIVSQSHTWEQRAAQLVKELPSFLKEVQLKPN